MSLYQLQRCVWDQVRAGQVNGSNLRAFDVNQYDLSETERTAFESKDIGKLYTMGLHPVLLNGYCRAQGLSRDEYRGILERLGEPETRKARWQR